MILSPIKILFLLSLQSCLALHRNLRPEDLLRMVNNVPLTKIDSDTPCRHKLLQYYRMNSWMCRGYWQGRGLGAAVTSYDAELCTPGGNCDGRFSCAVISGWPRCSRAFLQAGLLDQYSMLCPSRVPLLKTIGNQRKIECLTMRTRFQAETDYTGDLHRSREWAWGVSVMLPGPDLRSSHDIEY